MEIAAQGGCALVSLTFSEKSCLGVRGEKQFSKMSLVLRERAHGLRVRYEGRGHRAGFVVPRGDDFPAGQRGVSTGQPRGLRAQGKEHLAFVKQE